MAETFRITLAQLNPTARDIDGNAAMIRAAWAKARAAGADLLACPEMVLTGHPLWDPVPGPGVLHAAAAAVQALAKTCADGPALAIGAPWAEEQELFNAYLVCRGGKVVSVQRKHHLSHDERRYFTAGELAGPYAVNGVRIGSPIGGDAGAADVAETHAETGAEVLLVADASAYDETAFDLRLNHAVARTIETGLPVIWLNLVGGQDDLVFDGGSFGLNPRGEMAVKLPVFEEGLAHVDLEHGSGGWRIIPGEVALHPDRDEQDYHAGVLRLRDHLRKRVKTAAWLDLSGGATAALAAVLAVDALGADRLRCVWLQPEDSPDEAVQAALALAGRLGCRFDPVPMDGVTAAVTEAFVPLSAGMSAAELRQRLRGLLLEVLAGPEAVALTETGKAPGSAVHPTTALEPSRIAQLSRWRAANHRDWMRGPQDTGLAQHG